MHTAQQVPCAVEAAAVGRACRWCIHLPTQHTTAPPSQAAATLSTRAAPAAQTAAAAGRAWAALSSRLSTPTAAALATPRPSTTRATQSPIPPRRRSSIQQKEGTHQIRLLSPDGWGRKRDRGSSRRGRQLSRQLPSSCRQGRQRRQQHHRQEGRKHGAGRRGRQQQQACSARAGAPRGRVAGALQGCAADRCRGDCERAAAGGGQSA